MEFLLGASFVYLLLIAIVFFVKPKLDNSDTKIYSKLITANLIGILIDLSQYLMIKFNFDINISTIICKLFLVYVFTWTYLLHKYIISIPSDTDSTKKVNKFFDKISVFLLFIGVFAVFMSPISIINDSTGIYSKGMACVCGYVLISLYILLMLLTTFININNVAKKTKYVPFFVFLVLGTLATIIQAVFPNMLLITPTEAIITILTYFFIENPDLKMLNQVEVAKEHAEKANRAKTDFLSSMSHEIRTPLNAIVGFSEMITTEDDMDEIKSEAKDIVMASHTLLEIVNGILDISKIEANKMEIVNKEYELLPELENIAKLMVPRIGDKPLELNCKFAEDIPAVMYGDIAKIKEVITNILTNAVKYTDQGHIDFEVSCINEKEQSSLVIKVADTGRGIKKDQIDKLFNKFQRLDEDKNTTIEGTGLGLAITKSLVEMMGGRIIVTSEYGQGSTFTIYLKQKIVKLHKEATVNKFDDRDDYDFSGYKVLVVDDNQLNLKVATKLLTRYNITVETSDSGFDCIDKISKGNTYDLVLLDDMMPRMKGTETLTRLKQNNNYTIPTIALTANAITGMKEHYLSMGFNDYLGKPIEKLELLRVLSKYLKGKKNTEESIEKIEIKEEPSYNDKKILIVDDNKINIKIATKMLEKFNCVLDSAESGQECINKVKNTKYDIIFLDHMMPGMDGITTLGELKKIDGFSTPVIALTAEAIEGSKEKFMEAGFDGYISKPIDRNYLEELVKKILDNKGQ